MEIFQLVFSMKMDEALKKAEQYLTTSQKNKKRKPDEYLAALNVMVEVLTKNENHNEAKSYAATAIETAKWSADYSLVNTAVINMCALLEQKSFFKDSIKFCKDLAKHWHKEAGYAHRAIVRLSKAQAHQLDGDSKNAAKDFDLAKNLAVKSKDSFIMETVYPPLITFLEYNLMDREKALAALQEWEKTCTRVFGKKSRELEYVMREFKNFYLYQDTTFLKALSYAEKAWDVMVNSPAATPQQIIQAHEDLAYDYEEMGRRFFEKAQTCLQDAAAKTLETDENASNYRYSLYRLAGVTAKANNVSSGEKILKDLLEECKTKFGPQNPEYLDALKLYGNYLQEQNSIEKAITVFTQLLDLQKKVFKPNDTNAVITMETLARLYEDEGDDKEAAKYLKKAILASKKQKDKMFTIAANYEKYAELAEKAGNIAESENYLLKAFDENKNFYGPDHITTLGIAVKIALTYEKSNRQNLIDPLFKNLFEAGPAKPNPFPLSNPPFFYTTFLNALPADVNPLVKKWIMLFELRKRDETFGEHDTETPSLLKNLQGLYEKLGDIKEAEKIKKRLAGFNLKTP